VTVALYRRYRPESFADVIGQEHVTEPLMQALRTGRVNHAYLFSGPRGCGKTTSARILARCLNCEQGPTPTPCGECDSCVALARGGAGTVDVIEIDAASHGGVDDARDLRERASYGPAQSRYKIYIIDEAHMVTPQGFNALLKIVEEPPEHVKFIFATTEPEKVIGTIRSRTHHYPFRLVPPGQLQDYMESLCAKEGVAVAPGVLSFVVRAGGGSVRDSLSVLDQLIAGSGADGLTYESAASLLGFTDGELLDASIDAFAAGDAAGAFRAIERVIETGLDPRRFIEDLLERLRDLIVVAAIPDGSAAVLRGVPSDQIDRMSAQAIAFGAGALSRAADIVNAGLTEMTGATAPRLQLELIAARILLPGAAGASGHAARLDRIERRLDVGGTVGPVESARHSDANPQAPASRALSTEEAAPPRDELRPAPVPAPTATVSVTGPVESARHSDANPQAPASRALSREPGTGAPIAPVAPVGPVAAAAPGGIDVAAIRRAWPDVLAKLFETRRITWTFVSQHAQVLGYDGEQLLLGIATSGLTQTFRRGAHADYVREALIDVLGVEARVEGIPADGAAIEGDGPRRVAAVLPPTVSAEPTAPSLGPVTDDLAGNSARSHPPTVAPPATGASGSSPVAEAQARAQAHAEAAGPTPPGDGSAGPDPRSGTPAYESPVPTPSGQSWADVPSAPDSMPSWVSGDDAEVGDVTPDPPLSPLERARQEAARPEEAEAAHEADDSAVSDDDEDVEEAGEVGIPVVERLLGGTVIRDEQS